MKLETTAEEQYVAELIKDRGHYPKLARRMFDERNTLLARNEELERALREAPGVLAGLLDIARSEGFRCDDLQCGCPVGQGHKLAATLKALISGEEK